MIHAISYERFSPRPGEDTSESNDVQLQYNQAYCCENGYDWERSFQDTAISGGDPNRVGYWAALDYLRRGMVLVCYKRDRLCRGVYITLETERIVKKKGARIECVSGINPDDTPEGRLFRTMLAAFDEYRKDSDAARTKAFMLMHQQNGRAMSSQAPYGWRETEPIMVPDRNGVPKPQRRIEPDPREQAIVEQIKSLHAGGLKETAIAQRLNAELVPARGSGWHAMSVRRILGRV